MYTTVLAIIVLTNLIATIGSILLIRVARMELFALAAIMGIGGYTFAVLASYLSLSPVYSVCGAGFAGLLAGVCVWWLSGRLNEGELLAASLSLQLAFQAILTAWLPVTGGPSGLTNVPSLNAHPALLMALQVIFLFGLLIVYQMAMKKGLIGAALLSFCSDRLAQSSGIKTSAFRLAVTAFAAFILACGGMFQVQTTGTASPEAFGVGLTLTLYLAVIFMGSRIDFATAFATSAIFALLPEAFRLFGIATATSVAIRDLLLGGFLVFAAAAISRQSRGRMQASRDIA